MKKPKIHKAHGPEWEIQKEVVKMLRSKGWHVERLIGVAWQHGLSDLLVGHPCFGIRLIEIKNEDHYRWTTAQKWKMPILVKYGMPIWVLTGADDEQYQRLFKPMNFFDYFKEKDILNQQVINDLIDELDNET